MPRPFQINPMRSWYNACMLIDVEWYRGDVLLSGKARQEPQVRQMCLGVYREYGPAYFVHMFSRLYGFEIYPGNPNIRADYRFDLDTGVFRKIPR